MVEQLGFLIRTLDEYGADNNAVQDPHDHRALILMHWDEVKLLARCAYQAHTRLPSLNLVEVGSGVGGSALVIDYAVEDAREPDEARGFVVAVDPCLTPVQYVLKRTSGRRASQEEALHEAWTGRDFIKHLKRTSASALEGWSSGERLSFVLIDGRHEYEHVTRDVAWLEHVSPGGFALFHDYGKKMPGSKWGVTAAVHQLLGLHVTRWVVYGRRGNLLALERTP
jgi:hypothetical protein